MRSFGGARMDGDDPRDTVEVAVPVGALCFGCRRPVQAGDAGFLVTHTDTLGVDGTHPVAAWHEECLRQSRP